MEVTQFLDWLKVASQSQPSSDVNKPLIMGILNTTPNSFSDGGQYLAPNKACEHALQMIDQGADLIDIGGESSNPGASPIDLNEELNRVIPVIKQIRKHSNVCISIDTYKPEVMRAAVGEGANIINDIYALQKAQALATAAELAVPVCLMHMQNNPQTMQDKPHYPQGVVYDIIKFFNERLNACVAEGLKRELLILDPGFGFGKTVEDNLILTKKLDQLKQFGLPLLLGVSRKSTIGAILGKDVDKRLVGGIALAVYAVLKGASIIRTHDVHETKQAFQILDALYTAA